MLTITEEYKRQNLKSKSGKKDKNVALYSNDTGKGWKGGLSLKKNVEYFNCGKKGHYKSDCWAPGGGKEGQGPNQKGKGKQKENEKGKETGAATKEKEKEKVEEAWLAMAISDKSENESNVDHHSDFDGMPELVDVDNDSECDPLDIQSMIQEAPKTESDDEALSYVDFDEVDNLSEEFDTQYSYSDFDELDECTIDSFPSTPSPFDDKSDPLDLYAFEDKAYTSLNSNDIAGSVETRRTEVDLYNSGATHHMSGFCHRFINYIEIETVPITAADEQTFKAIGKGEMYVFLPNGEQPASRVLLKDVLFAPSMGVTLISIS